MLKTVVGLTVVLPFVFSLVGCRTCPSPCPAIPKPQLSPEVVSYLEKTAHDHFEGKTPEKLVVELQQEAKDSIARQEPLAMREVYDRVDATIRALEGPDGKPAAEFAKAVESLRELLDELHSALWQEVVSRVLAVHKICFGAATVRENLAEWQAGSFYLGLLPEARTAEEATKYQELYTSHEQAKEKITGQAQIRYSKWAVGQMKAFAQAFRSAKEGLNDDENAMVTAGTKYLGPIVTSGMTAEASQLYNSLIQDVFGELKPDQRASLIEGIENAQKNQPYGDPYSPEPGPGAPTDKKP